MRVILGFFTSSLGKKYLMSVTGLYVSIFLVIHLLGNLLLLIPDDGKTFLDYAHSLENSLFIQFNRILLLLSLLIHFVTAVRLSIQNYLARGAIRYKVYNAAANTSFASRYVLISALLVLLFLILHLFSFSIPYTLGFTDKNLYELVIEKFKNPYYASIYVFSMLFLSLHLSHGFSSLFQSVGVRDSKFLDIIRFLAFILSYVVPFSFALLSIFLYFNCMSCT